MDGLNIFPKFYDTIEFVILIFAELKTRQQVKYRVATNW